MELPPIITLLLNDLLSPLPLQVGLGDLIKKGVLGLGVLGFRFGGCQVWRFSGLGV